MKISHFCKAYTDVKLGCPFSMILGEVGEFFVALVKLNFKEMKEEFHDIVSFVQMWLYYNYNVDGNLWRMAMPAYDKYMARRKYWDAIYDYVGLDRNVSTYCGNYQRRYKVISQLSRFGINEVKAVEAYEKIVK